MDAFGSYAGFSTGFIYFCLFFSWAWIFLQIPWCLAILSGANLRPHIAHGTKLLEYSPPPSAYSEGLFKK